MKYLVFIVRQGLEGLVLLLDAMQWSTTSFLQLISSDGLEFVDQDQF